LEPRIERINERKLIGNCLLTSFANDKTYELWSGFMPKRHQINHQVGTVLYSLQEYDFSFDQFSPQREFVKWAAVEVSSFDNQPEHLKAYTLKEGLYAVFIHRGEASKAAATFNYIFATWLPSSVYEVDNRAHFELLGEKYKNNHPDSEEEVWIPIRLK